MKTLQPEETTTYSPRNLFLYFVFTLAWTWIFWGIPAITSSHLDGDVSIFGILSIPTFTFRVLGGMGPILVAFSLVYITEGKQNLVVLIKRGLEYRFKKIWWIPLILIALVIMGLAYFVTGLFQPVVPVYWMYPIDYLIFAVALLPNSIIEEYGWRGYALDRLQVNSNALISSLVLGLIWGFWHLPLFYISGTSQSNGSFLMFLILAILLSILFTWFHNNAGGSVLVAIVFHTAINISFSIMPTYDPFVQIVALIIVIAIVLYWGPSKLKRNNS